MPSSNNPVATTLPMSRRDIHIIPLAGRSHVYTTAEYSSLASQFGAYVLISTFTASLIVSILSFARDTIDPELGASDPITRRYTIAKVLSLSVICFHFGVIIVGGRACALCFRLIADSSHVDLEANKDESVVDTTRDSLMDPISGYRKVRFYRYVIYCERVQLIGTLLLILSVLLMGFSIFAEQECPWILIGVVAVVAYSIYRTGFWNVSVVRESILGLFQRVRDLSTRKKKEITSAPVSQT